MKAILILIFWFCFVGCKFSNNSAEKSNDLLGINSMTPKNASIPLSIEDKRNKIRESLIKKGVFSFISVDTLFIYQDGEKELARFRLPKYGNIENFYLELDTSYSINQEKIKNGILLIVRKLCDGEADPSNFVIYNTVRNKIVLNIPACYVNHYWGCSENCNYFIIESGTSACSRGFTIYDTNSLEVKQSPYNSCVNDSNQLKWNGNKFYYYLNCTDKSNIPAKMRKLKDNEVYAQKYYWVNGKDSLTNEFVIAGDE